MLRTAVIMAGGSGERFWPLSRHTHPKQLLRLTDPDRSLLAEAVDRILPLFPPEHIFIATARHLQEPIRRAGLGIPDANILAEPCKRNTSGCLAYAGACLLHRFQCPPEELSTAILTADHQIGNEAGFRATVEAALTAAEQQRALVTLGVRPTRIETGYGYIEVQADLSEITMAGTPPRALPVLRFREKPDADSARHYVESGRFLWNSGLFFWTLSTFLAELEAVNPPLAEAVLGMRDALAHDDTETVERVFAGIEGLSIDYALMEKAARVLVVPAGFAWDDVGAWDALDRTYPHDHDGNVVVGDPVLVDTQNCIVCNEPGAERMAVAVVGGRELVVVVSADGVLVVDKARVQDVKTAVQSLRNRNATQL